MKRYFTIFFLVFFISVKASAHDCTYEDEKYAKSRYYSLQESLDFAEKIKIMVRGKDLRGIFNLADGELYWGPRRAFALSKKFEEIFSDKWVEEVLEAPLPCSSYPKYEAFPLGGIWYKRHYESNKWYIWVISGALEEELGAPIGWKVDGSLISRNCFATEWLSGDNFELIAEELGLSKNVNFSENVGFYLGRTPSSFEKMASLIIPVKECQMQGEYEVRDGAIFVENTVYKVLVELSKERCQKLVPHLWASCEKAYLVQVADAGGSWGYWYDHGIYGLFDIRNQGKSIIPLKFFNSQNEGLNFVFEN
ncbi:hypothetical protein [Terasakiella sp. SH-1]|uniref:hypothetical protein n=1 Tax=Terasakiella sp. SH-1 TaxID=2560057 RepID=UPI0010733D33|nr:hypothetical protein [Terasakiella sp. SH-1]